MSLTKIYGRYLETQGTKAFAIKEAYKFFSNSAGMSTQIQLTHGDLLNSFAGQRHKEILLSLARLFWPRFIIRIFFKTWSIYDD